MDKTNALSLTGGGMFDGGWTPVWLIKDEFTDTVAAGSVNGTAATPGPGTRTVTDASSLVSVGSGLLSMSGKNVAYTDPIISYGIVERNIGTALICRMEIGGGANAIFGFQNKLMFKINSAAQLWCLDNSNGTGSSPIFSTSYSGSRLAIVALSAGGLFFQNNTLLWVGRASTGDSAPIAATYDVSFDFDFFRVLQLPAPFDTDDGLATDTHSGSVAAGTTFTHEADALIEFTVTTLATSGWPSVTFRSVDANNLWLIEIEGGSGNLRLYERVSGAYSQRGFAASAVSDGTRIVVIADNQSISLYADNTKLFTYANAANFATATAGLTLDFGTGGAISDLITWPRTLSGTAAAILDKASA